MATGYGNQQYWEDRYKSQANSYEWYMPWETLKPHCLPHFHATHASASDAAAAPHQHPHLSLAEQRKAIAKADAAASAAVAAPAHSSNGVPESAGPASASSAPASSSSAASAAYASASAGSSLSAEVAPIPASTAATPPAAPAPICPLCLSSRLLIVGCGNSELSAHLYAEGFRHQLSVDYSEVVIAKMREMYGNNPALASTFLVGDCRDLKTIDAAALAKAGCAFVPTAVREGGSDAGADGCSDAHAAGGCFDAATLRDGSCFDIVFDKGTLDAIMCGSESSKNAQLMLLEIHRILKPGGVFLLVTYGQPSARLPHLERKQYAWTVTQQSLGPTRYLYVCKKRPAKNAR